LFIVISTGEKPEELVRSQNSAGKLTFLSAVEEWELTRCACTVTAFFVFAVVQKTEADRERAGEWYWMPHALEGFVPARLVSENAQKRQLETEDMKQHAISKKEVPNMDRLYWTQLRFLQKDLVMLDVMSHPLISQRSSTINNATCANKSQPTCCN
jgi:hypothetical protein